MITRITEGERIPFGLSWTKLKAHFYHGSPEYFVIWLQLPWWGYRRYGPYKEFHLGRTWLLQIRIKPKFRLYLVTPWRDFGDAV